MTTDITATPDTPRGPVDIIATCTPTPVSLTITRGVEATVIGSNTGSGSLAVSNDAPGYGTVTYTVIADLGGGASESASVDVVLVDPAVPTVEVDAVSTCVTVQVVGTGATGEAVRLYRVDPDGSAVKVRGGYTYPVDPTLIYTVLDCEAPLYGSFGYCVVHWFPVKTLLYSELLVECPLYSQIPDKYVVYADFFRDLEPPEPTEPCSDLLLQAPDCPVWLKNPYRPELNIGLCCVTRMPERVYAANALAPRPFGQNLAVSVWDVRSGWSGAMEFVSTTTEEMHRLRAVFADGGPLLLQSVAEWGAFQDWVQPDAVQESHVAGWIDLLERIWTFGMVTVQPPGDTTMAEPSQAEFDSLEARVDDLEIAVFGESHG